MKNIGSQKNDKSFTSNTKEAIIMPGDMRY